MSVTTTTTSLSAYISESASAVATCTNPKPGKNGYLPPDACDVILLYVPSFGAAILFPVLFGLTLICHGVQGFMYKKKYTWVIMMGALWELLAFIFRTLLTRNQSSAGYDTGHVIMFLLAPLWIKFLYMTLGRMIYFFLPDKRLGGISARRYGLVFVWLDIISFIIQLAGASITTQTDASSSTIMLGVHIYMGGIGLQEFFILVFTGLTVHLHRQMLSMEHSGNLDPEKLNRCSMPWPWLRYAIYTTLGMITIRIIFRLCQYARGTDPSNPVLTHEVYEYVFDALPMFFALVIQISFILRAPFKDRTPNFQRSVARKRSVSRKRRRRQRKRSELGRSTPGVKERALRSTRFVPRKNVTRMRNFVEITNNYILIRVVGIKNRRLC
ncbi:RTA1 like protein-domain-containing protein [Lipomyces orientalis]|uniref:RTA1 like protein-domain-containing protein n=1 Tax=Lipomyces orientalis TaxID=1233043 RepID=A0ACC3TCC9_9ASCO